MKVRLQKPPYKSMVPFYAPHAGDAVWRLISRDTFFPWVGPYGHMQ